MRGVDPSLHNEESSHYVMCSMFSLCYFETLYKVLPGIVKVFIGYLFPLHYCCFIPIEI